MKRNSSLPRMNMIQISNRLNRLKVRNKPRLQFPTKVESKKHYFDSNTDRVVIGSETQQSPPHRQTKRSNLDVSDIEGARPKMIQKQKNVMRYYQHKHQAYNPFLPIQQKLYRALSEPKFQPRMHTQVDSLDLFQRQVQKKLVINQNPQRQSRQSEKSQKILRQSSRNSQRIQRQYTEPTINKYENDLILKKKIGQGSGYTSDVQSNFQKPKFQTQQRKSLVFNPTFLSNLVLL